VAFSHHFPKSDLSSIFFACHKAAMKMYDSQIIAWSRGFRRWVVKDEIRDLRLLFPLRGVIHRAIFILGSVSNQHKRHASPSGRFEEIEIEVGLGLKLSCVFQFCGWKLKVPDVCGRF
jgi:hypothetical protein